MKQYDGAYGLSPGLTLGNIVPLDYQTPNLGRASVPLIKLPANTTSSLGPYQGMVLINPGGPGGSAVDEVQNNGVAYYQSLTGDNWDIVGFEPRGIYRSEPNINCSATANTSQTAKLDSRIVPDVTDDFFINYIQAGVELGERCQDTVGGERDAGPHMSTTTNARDMVSIVDAFTKTADGERAAKPSHLLNYFGYSYGTFLGQVFASMFPGRVGNMVLDGVLSLDLPLGEDLNTITTPADGVIASFFVYCYEAGPSQCSFYTGSSALDIFNRFNQSFVELNAERAQIENWTNATDLEAALLAMKTALYYSVASPGSTFDVLSDAMVTLEQALIFQQLPAWTEQIVAVIGDPTAAGEANAELRLDLEPAIEHLREVSIVGEIVAKSMLGCLGWSIEATDVFSGPFGGDTATPILFVGNTYDPISPVSNALAAAPNYKNAQVVTVDATGHTSRVAGNSCQRAKVNAYFQTTQLPGIGSYCSLETGPFGITLNSTLEHIIHQAGLSQLVLTSSKEIVGLAFINNTNKKPSLSRAISLYTRIGITSSLFIYKQLSVKEPEVMIDEDSKYFSFSGDIPIGGPSTWHITDWDQRRVVSVTMDGEQDSEDTAIERFRRLSSHIAPNVHRIHISNTGEVVSTYTDPENDPTRCVHYPRFSEIPVPEGIRTLRRDELEEIERLGPNADLVCYTPCSGASAIKAVFKYYFFWQLAYASWKEMNLWMRLPRHSNIVPFDRIVLDELEGRVVDLLNLRYGIVHQDIAPRNLLVDESTDSIKLFDFNLASRIRGYPPQEGESYDEDRNDVKGVIFTTYELITRDYSLRSVPHEEQNLEDLSREWIKHPGVKLDCAISSYRLILQRWRERRAGSLRDIPAGDIPEAIDWPARPRVPEKTISSNGPNGQLYHYIVESWDERRQDVRDRGGKVSNWERPAQRFLDNGTRVLSSAAPKLTSCRSERIRGQELVKSLEPLTNRPIATDYSSMTIPNTRLLHGKPSKPDSERIDRSPTREVGTPCHSNSDSVSAPNLPQQDWATTGRRHEMAREEVKETSAPRATPEVVDSHQKPQTCSRLDRWLKEVHVPSTPGCDSFSDWRRPSSSGTAHSTTHSTASVAPSEEQSTVEPDKKKIKKVSLTEGLRTRRVEFEERAKDPKTDGLKNIIVSDVRINSLLEQTESLCGKMQLVLNKATDLQEGIGIYDIVEELSDAINDWKSAAHMATATNRDFEKDLRRCNRDDANEAIFQRTVLMSILNRYQMSEIFDFNCEAQWFLQGNPHPLPSTEENIITAPKPDLAIFFRFTSLIGPGPSWKSMPIPDNLRRCMRPDGSFERCFPFIFIEAKKGFHDLTPALIANMHSASQALFNIYMWMSQAGRKDEFFSGVRLFSIAINPRQFELRVHRAQAAEEGVGEGLEFYYDEICKGHRYKRDDVCNLLRNILVEYAEKTLFNSLRESVMEVLQNHEQGQRLKRNSEVAGLGNGGRLSKKTTSAISN
ncbi:hypothetical protein O1611_g3847 [Lasiodiplodia mahajangana]|uniref:Uncharacterized protein n=1 Tax=Lasiodiplodia mahajangana TaxID=1108764 RepID=A0ACC2JQI4_9PEZI|nr:hypothetical protein O1611_g3847 [Lasiodiplodia mahajangana]